MTRSFWHTDTAQLATASGARPEAVPDEVDVAVVGGGVTGCATSYWLGRAAPGLRVALFEAGGIGDGASGRNAGFLLQGTASSFVADEARYGRERAYRLWRFTVVNRDLIVRAFDAPSVGLRTCGALLAAGSAEEAEELREAAQRLRALGEPASFVSAAWCKETLGSHGYHGGLWNARGAEVHPVRLVYALARAGTARVFANTPVLGIEPHGAAVRLRTAAGPVRARRVVLAMGAYLPRLVPALASWIQPVRAQMLVTDRAPADALPFPVYSHHGYFYIRRESGGRILLGGARHLHRQEELGYTDATTPALQADLQRYLATHFPALATLQTRHRWSGTMGFSPDGLPIVGILDRWPQVHYIGGYTGHGMAFAVHLARLVVDRVVERDDPEALALFAPDRLREVLPGTADHSMHQKPRAIQP